MAAVASPADSVTLVTQTRVQPGKDAEFAAWQKQVNDAVAAVPGFLDHSVVEPAPPTQPDWVIVQRFSSREAAQAWLGSEERQRLLAQIEPVLVGQDDIHLFASESGHTPDTAVSAVISTSVAPEKEAEFRAWQARIAAVESAAPGFKGIKLEPPIPGVQDDWATIVRFDSEENLQSWLTSPQRQRLLEEASTLGAESRVRTVRGGFDGWFTFGGEPAGTFPPAWKQNMVVLLVIYAVVFLLGEWVQTPLLLDNGVPFWLALFLTNALGTALMGFIIMPPVNDSLKWWLLPRRGAPKWTNAAGVAIILAMYGLCLAVFSQF